MTKHRYMKYRSSGSKNMSESKSKNWSRSGNKSYRSWSGNWSKSGKWNQYKSV